MRLFRRPEAACTFSVGRLEAVAAAGSAALAHGLFAVRVGARVMIYRNACPHLGVALDWVPGRFLSVDGQHIVCAMHGAIFRREDGYCVRGPCRGERLTLVPSEVRDGEICVPADAVRAGDQG